MSIKGKNQGFTLIELITVMAIITLVAGIGIVSVANLSYANTKKAAGAINSELEIIRLNSMAKTENYILYLYNRNGSLYKKVTIGTAAEGDLTAGNGDKLLESGRVYYTLTDGTRAELTEGKSLSFYFDKSSGAFLSEVTALELKKGSHTSSLYLVKETGRHWVK